MVWLRFYVTTHFMQTVSRNGATRVVRSADTLKRPNMSWIICAANVVLTRFVIIDKYIVSLDRNWRWMVVFKNLWICLICGHVGCGRYVRGHAYDHFQLTQHTYSMQMGNNRVWDYAADNYVHRLIQNKTDGKLVQLDEGGRVVTLPFLLLSLFHRVV